MSNTRHQSRPGQGCALLIGGAEAKVSEVGWSRRGGGGWRVYPEEVTQEEHGNPLQGLMLIGQSGWLQHHQEGRTPCTHPSSKGDSICLRHLLTSCLLPSCANYCLVFTGAVSKVRQNICLTCLEFRPFRPHPIVLQSRPSQDIHVIFENMNDDNWFALLD